MCLAKQDKKKKIISVGYKIFRVSNNGQLYSEFRGIHTHRPVGQWLDEGDYRGENYQDLLLDDTKKVYKIGWHTFEKYSDAWNWRCGDLKLVVRKVEVREVTTSGMQNLKDRCVVSKYIKIIKGSCRQ